jgi:Raf kinase inhibitor-like YbhB/YbcL family protein
MAPGNGFRRLLLITLAITAAARASLGTEPAHAAPAPRRFVLTSSDSRLSLKVPEVYTAKAFGCTGGNASPPLQWRGAPPGTRSFVVTLFDRDERSTPSGWWHWVVYDIPAGAAQLSTGAGTENSGSLPAGSIQGRSELGENAYHGPCPAAGDSPHRYMFMIYALDVDHLPVAANSSGAMVTSVAQDHLLAKAVFVARYGRERRH